MDKGIPLRRAAFDCMSSMLDFYFQKLNLNAFSDYTMKGLSKIFMRYKFNDFYCRGSCRRCKNQMLRNFDKIHKVGKRNGLDDSRSVSIGSKWLFKSIGEADFIGNW